MTTSSTTTKPWVELYRPTTLDGLFISDATRRLIQACLAPGNRTHIMIEGPPGTGKTTTARCMGRSVLGDMFSRGYHEVNSADERGAEVISSLVVPFCRHRVSDVPYKIAVLDEADGLTANCQTELAAVMKTYSYNTRFIIICNDPSAICEALQSLCQLISYVPGNRKMAVDYLRRICEAESLEYTRGALKLLHLIAAGDMRKLVNNLQKVSYSSSQITTETVLHTCHYPDPEIIGGMIQHAIDGDLMASYASAEDLLQSGFYYLDIISSTVGYITYAGLDPDVQMGVYDLISQLQLSLQDESIFYTQFISTVCQIYQLGRKLESGE